MIGGRADSDAGPVCCMRWVDWFRFVFELLYWLCARPARVIGLMRRLVFRRYGSWTNWGENLLGFAFAVRFAKGFERAGYRCSHATWATGPGMAVYVLKQLTGLPYTLEAHAYDVFRDGGDAFLTTKLQAAQALRSSTDATTGELQARLGFGPGNEVVCVRRGLTAIPQYRAPAAAALELKALSVGRLIEKKVIFINLRSTRNSWRAVFRFMPALSARGPCVMHLRARLLSSAWRVREAYRQTRVCAG